MISGIYHLATVMLHASCHTVEDYESSSFATDNLVQKLYLSEGYFRRILTILPLYTPQQQVVPIPCIIDTGAPTTLVLGVGAMVACHLCVIEQVERSLGITGTSTTGTKDDNMFV